MEKTRPGYHGRASALTQWQMEESRIALRARVEKEKASRKEQYWVRYKDITIDDVNALLGIYARVTDFTPLPIDEPKYKKFCEEFASDFGIGEYPIQKGSNLEANRRIGFNGELFARFKITGGHINSKYEKDRTKIIMRDEIDAYFLSKNMAIPLRKTY